MDTTLRARPGMLSALIGAHGREICRAADGVLIQADDASAGQPRICLLRSAERPEIGFLLAEDGGAMHIVGQTGARPFRLVWLSAALRADRLALRDPFSNLMLSVAPEDRAMRAHAAWVAAWEEFSLGAPVDRPALRSLEAVCRAIVQAVDDPVRAVSLMQTVPATLAGPTLEALLLLCDDPAAAALAGALLAAVPPDAPEACAPDWSARLIDEPWFAPAIRGLRDKAARAGDRSMQRPVHHPMHRVDDTYDMFGRGVEFSSFSRMSPGHRFLRHARRLHAPTKTLCLVATARDEGIAILEWVAHHRAIGVEHIFLYTNTLSDGSEPLLRALAEAGIITWLDNTPAADAGPLDAQRKAYAHALSILPDTLDYAWTLIVDLDEFLLPSAFWQHDIRPVLRAGASRRADSIAFPWRVFYPGQQLVHGPALMGLRYDRIGDNPLVKSAFRTNRFAFADPHHPHPYPDEARIWVTADQVLHEGERPMYWSPVQNGIVCHYALRSLEEFVWKFARGENDGSGVLARKFFRVRNGGVVQHYLEGFTQNLGTPDDRYAAIAPAVEAERAALLTLPGVAEAHAQVLATFRAQIGALVRDSRDYVAGLSDLSPEDKTRWSDLVERWESAQRGL